MNKQDVVDVVAGKTGTTKTLVQAVLDEFMGVDDAGDFRGMRRAISVAVV